MSIFQTAKQIASDDAARRLGLKENRGRWLCPFHDDHTPSMACYKENGRFYCFACHAKGDAVDLWAKVRGVPLKDAAEELCRSYGLNYHRESPQETARRMRQQDLAQLPMAVMQDWRRVMVDLLQEWLNADSRIIGMYDNPEGWAVRQMLSHMAKLNDESLRLQALLPEELPEEIALQRRGEAPDVGLPKVDAEMLLDILMDRLRATGMRLTSEECDQVHRKLGINVRQERMSV